MRKSQVLFIALIIVLILAGIKEVRAEIKLTECFSVTGFLRYELAVHTAQKNPNNIFQTDNNDLNFSRTYFQTEWTYKPSDRFKLFSKIRITGDQTEDFDNELGSYNAFPIDVPEGDWTMLKASKDQFRAEVWELYTDLNIGNLWLRLGKQQIVWGEMIASRLMDVINPLDFSRNFLFEPEEFENIRIPNWAIRGRYQFGRIGSLVNDFIIEGFVNPGDVLPTQYADFGSPFNVFSPFPPFLRIHDKDRRGDTEFGFRLGGMVKSFYLTLNYLSLYSDEFLLKLKGITPDPIFGIPIFAPVDFTPYALLFDAAYPSINIYGLTCNYFIAPLNTVATFEGAWVPDQPYQDAFAAATGGSSIRDQGTWSYAIRLDRQTFVFPRPTSAMMIQLQFNQTIREGDHDKILGAANSKVDQTDETIALLLDQFFSYNNYRATFLVVYDFDDGTYFKPSFKYTYGTHWYFDLYGIFLGGSDKRPGRFGGIDWANEVVGRITFQF